MSDRIGYTTVRVLPELDGRPWDDYARAYMRAVRPSKVRLIEPGDCETSDACCWRVTVFLDGAGCVGSIYQEVEVLLPDGVAHGFDLRERLRGGR